MAPTGLLSSFVVHPWSCSSVTLLVQMALMEMAWTCSFTSWLVHLLPPRSPGLAPPFFPHEDTALELGGLSMLIGVSHAVFVPAKMFLLLIGAAAAFVPAGTPLLIAASGSAYLPDGMLVRVIIVDCCGSGGGGCCGGGWEQGLYGAMY